ncbi:MULTISPECIES: hypothetical protein [unclassified Rhodococcus (in: high G+C Gram-positive bacteria)]|uniref:hypothetical protein n=1 Tax=unclassified Rhodococcus (in: high G+C Gram-positive bacteria) TaxID=192944 RepID=UPI000925F4DF|nr:hypothetical protein [Rhodococcus sp. M8]
MQMNDMGFKFLDDLVREIGKLSQVPVKYFQVSILEDAYRVARPRPGDNLVSGEFGIFQILTQCCLHAASEGFDNVENANPRIYVTDFGVGRKQRVVDHSSNLSTVFRQVHQPGHKRRALTRESDSPTLILVG